MLLSLILYIISSDFLNTLLVSSYPTVRRIWIFGNSRRNGIIRLFLDLFRNSLSRNLIWTLIRSFWSGSLQNWGSSWWVYPNISDREEWYPLLRLFSWPLLTRNSSVFFWHEVLNFVDYWVEIYVADVVWFFKCSLLCNHYQFIFRSWVASYSL